MDTWTGGKRLVRRRSRSTHLVNISQPVPWHRRVADPILQHPGPVPEALGPVFPLHNSSPPPFLHCGPGPFSLSVHSQPGTSGIINFSAHSQRSVPKPIKCRSLRAEANHRTEKRSTDRRVTNQNCDGKKTAFLDPTRPVECLSRSPRCPAGGALSAWWNDTWCETRNMGVTPNFNYPSNGMMLWPSVCKK